GRAPDDRIGMRSGGYWSPQAASLWAPARTASRRPRKNKPTSEVSKPKHVNHAGDRIKAERHANVRRRRAQNDGGGLDIGFHCGFHRALHAAELAGVYAKLMPHSTKF